MIRSRALVALTFLGFSATFVAVACGGDSSGGDSQGGSTAGASGAGGTATPVTATWMPGQALVELDFN